MLVNEKADMTPVKKIDLEIGDMIPHRKFAVNMAEWPFNLSFISHYFGRKSTKSTNCFVTKFSTRHIFFLEPLHHPAYPIIFAAVIPCSICISATHLWQHIYPTGGHGWGYQETFLFKSEVHSALADWLRSF